MKSAAKQRHVPDAAANIRRCIVAPVLPRCPTVSRHKVVKAGTRGIQAEDLVGKAVALYEEVWSKGKVLMLDTIMAEDHVQADKVWQPERRASGGRRSMKRGILAYRAAYPDLVFKVLCASSVAAQPRQGSDSALAGDGGVGSTGLAGSKEAEEPSRTVFVHWSAEGTNLGPIREAPPSGKRVSFSGISRLDFDSEGRIETSHVYRQAPVDEAAYFLSQGISPGAPTKFQEAESNNQ